MKKIFTLLKLPAIKSIKIFLKNNKIFFEFINLIIFGIVTLGVGLQANNLINKQNEIIKKDYLPFIYINDHYIGPNYEEHILEIRNNGGNLYNFSSDIYTKLKLIGSNLNISINFNLKYFDTSFGGNQKVGLLETKYGYNNNQIYNSFNKELLSGSYKYNFSEIEHFIRISYTDTFGETHTDFYKYNNGDWNKINSNEGITNINEIEKYNVIELINLKQLLKK